MHLLLIEDNKVISKGLIYTLENNGYQVTCFDNCSDVKANISNQYDVVILDISLPDGDGFNLYQDYIKTYNIPTIFLTARDDEDDIVKGLELGAEDYITKPFSSKELLARINRILVRKQKSNVLEIGNIKYDYDKMAVYKDEKLINLSSLELKLINLLFNNINHVVTREAILEMIWESTGNDVDDHTVTVYFKRLREKLGTDIIKTIKGVGYRIDEK